MSDASNVFGGPIVLPETSQVTPSDVGAVWMNQLHGDTAADSQTTVVVTIPSRGIIISYERPTVPDPVTYIEQSARSEPGSQLISLGGVPAWAIPAPADGSSWGLIQFIVGGATIQVDGHTDLASLEAIAQSIVDRATAAG